MSKFGIICGGALTALLSCGAAMAETPATFGKCVTTGEAGSIQITTREPDTLIVGTVLPNPGWWNGFTPEKIEDGFEYCIAAEIAHRAGVHNLKVMNMAWDQYISGAGADYDIALASTTITEPRKQVFDFSQPYFSSNLGVAIKTGADVTAENIRSKRIGVLQGNMGADWVTSTLLPESGALLFQTQADMLTALMADQLDAVITDTTLVLTATFPTNGVLSVVAQYSLDQGYGVVTPKDSPNSAAVDKAIGEITANGSLANLAETYLAPLFGTSPTAVPMWELK